MMDSAFSTKSRAFHIKSKIWIEDDDGHVIFGLGRLRMLEAIERLGSLNAAARELKMSYRGLWGKIKATEEGLGAPLLLRNTGGASGGGSQLTELAKHLMAEFRDMHRHVNHDADLFYNDVFSRNLNDREASADEKNKS